MKKTAEKISLFRNEYYFLSNMYPCEIKIGRYTFSCAEAAFQAYKCADKREIRKFEGIDGFEAKKLGKEIALRGDWEVIKLRVMIAVLRFKFGQHSELMDRLIKTGDAELVEGNRWGDRFWGVCGSKGDNWLGKLLMGVREEALGVTGGILPKVAYLEEFAVKYGAQELLIKAKREEVLGRPAVDAGMDVREYAGMKLYFEEEGFNTVISINESYGKAFIAEDAKDEWECISIWLNRRYVDELNKIGELFYSYSDDEVKEDAYNEDRSVEPEDDNYWDKDRSEYVNRFSEDVEHNWDARYNHYTPIFKRSFRDDEPEFRGTFYNSQYAELKEMNHRRFEAASKKSKYKLWAE